MINNQVKNDIDRLWLDCATGGVSNSLIIIEQISFLIFARLLDMEEAQHERNALRSDESPHHLFRVDQQTLRWQNWSRMSDGEDMLKFVRDEVFPHLRILGGKKFTFGEYIKNVSLQISKSSLLVSMVEQIEKLPLGNADIQGDLYEYLLSKLTTAGIHGQFRTPRHIIKLMVELIDPKPFETIGDLACGTAGFLVAAMEHLRKAYAKPELAEALEGGSNNYSGEQFEYNQAHIRHGRFHGFDFDATMLRLAAMNLMLHGVENPDLHYIDTLSKEFPEKFPEIADGEKGGLDIILSNPPFKGTLAEDVHPSLLKIVQTKKSELLFIVLVLHMLKSGGRSAIVVSDGVLLGSSKAHLAAREYLLDHNRLEGVISLPCGIFRSFAGLSTAILVFTKGGCTQDVFFYDAQDDGFLDEEKCLEHTDEDLSDVLIQYRCYRSGESDFSDRTAKAFKVSAADIRAHNFELSIRRYRGINHQEVKCEEPKVILARMQALEIEIQRDMIELEAMLR
ncbi:Type I restriction-modification system, DNA-methyltransferase subunit M [Candidatus Nitrotoga sp. HW29]|uniref:class I SAM-dependent DNA methyltransferase n=1 Tax=Candidatus Nitrotoga sp. HW29 TaxID=2886963 RepID=UPI001EF2199D|nr:class I SAM-dependent DNA methyltransferase [Candidatus Nitrotoga sp. HW29]CAH1906186.1 Type I restriction-modification system, DNA-methyltransferase subunit M [Candidatus Nitrotoga sp. HW29]